MRTFPTAEGDRVQLSTREREVLRLAACGFTNKEIAASMAVAEGTVKAYMKMLFEGLGFESRTEAALWCVCHPEVLRGFAVAREPRTPAFLSEVAA